MILQKCGNYWCRINSSQVVNSSLANGTTSTVVAIGSTQTGTDCHSTFTTWSNSSGNNIRTGTCNKTPNGLWYDGCQGGKISFSLAVNYCSSKGMRLPNYSEGYNSTLYCGYGYAWTNSLFQSPDYYNLFDTSEVGCWGTCQSANKNYVRCVK